MSSERKETAYYVVFYGYDTEKRVNVTQQAIVTLLGQDLHTVEGLQTLTKMIEDELKVERVCLMNQIELSEIPASGVFKI